MRVTGWTYWGNTDYIDINEKITFARYNAIHDNCIEFPTPEELSELTDEEKLLLFKKRNQQVEDALNTPEIQEMNDFYEACYQAAVYDVKKHGYHFDGNTHQNAEWGVPIIDNKYIICLSMRSWGRLMVDAFPDEIDDSDGYGYIEWAWSTPEGAEVKHYDFCVDCCESTECEGCKYND